MGKTAAPDSHRKRRSSARPVDDAGRPRSYVPGGPLENGVPFSGRPRLQPPAPTRRNGAGSFARATHGPRSLTLSNRGRKIIRVVFPTLASRGQARTPLHSAAPDRCRRGPRKSSDFFASSRRDRSGSKTLRVSPNAANEAKMRHAFALLAALFLAAGLPLCRCGHPAGASCGDSGAFGETAAAPSCCERGSDARGETIPGGGEGGACCCLGIDAPDSAAVVPTDAPARAFAPLDAAAPFLATAPPEASALPGAPAGPAGARAVSRSAPDVPLFRLHAALLL